MKPYLFFLLLFSFICFTGGAQKCLSGNCSTGWGKYQYEDGSVYEGDFFDDKREGFGTYRWKTGELFIGESVANEFEGFGKITFKEGDVYIGDFKKGLPEGYGIKTFSNGTKYIGFLKKGMPDGEGRMFYTDRTTQMGIFDKGKYLGKVSYYNNAVGATGCLNGNCDNGYGMKSYVGGDYYWGNFKNSKREGYGTYYWDDGTRWVGEFSEGQLTGYGTYTFINGEKYVGFFEQSKRNGWGLNYNEDGKKELGFWKNNILVQSKAKLANGIKEGCVSGDCRDGEGKYIFQKGYYEGSFKDGYRHGEGTYYLDNGEYYKGSFSNNKYNGKGIYYFANHDKYEGEWKEQQFYGKGILYSFADVPKDGYWNDGAFNGKKIPAGYESWLSNAYGVTKENKGRSPVTGKPAPATTKPSTAPTTIFTGTIPEEFKIISGTKKLALVIGNAAYAFTQPLENPVNDAHAITKTLQESGFEVIELINGTKKQMEDTIRYFGAKLKSYEVLLFYYAGHGVQLDNQNYMIPVDFKYMSEADYRDDCKTVRSILDRMSFGYAKVNIIILDACRTNPFSRGSREEENGWAAMKAPLNTVIAFATGAGTVAADGAKGTNGVYTGSLVKYMKLPGLQIENVFKLTGKFVEQKSQQKQFPTYESNFYDLFFFRSN
ncbi:MAG: caspase family protein [Lacibacter sp.]|nr:caspase family protein [Lacibacter sp.]